MAGGRPAASIEQQLALQKRTLKLIDAREHLIPFSEITMPHPADPDNPDLSEYEALKHHRAIAAVLEEFVAGTIPLLILAMPPRHGKSELVSRRLPSWILGKDPRADIIFGTYNEEFAGDFGSDVREIMRSAPYKQVFPGTRLMRGEASKNKLKTEAGGAAYFVGRGGSITGRGGDYILLDDLIKDAVEASSPAIRQQAWDWFTKVVLTRRSSGSARICIVMTRWHEDDIVGRLTDPRNPCYHPEEAARWKIINLPAIAEDDDPLGREPGEVLWPGKFDMEYLQSQKRLDPHGFSALYQQRPAAEDGDFFKREWIKYYAQDALPKNLRIYAASDHAIGEDKTRHDRTCLLVYGLDEFGNVYLLDCWWKRAGPGPAIEAMVDLMGRWKPLTWRAERTHITKSIGPFLRTRMHERGVYCAISEITPVGNKEARAQSIQGRMSMGMVYFPLHAWWTADAVDELMSFPHGRHDDFVDTVAYVGLGLTKTVNASAPVAPKPVPKTGTLKWIKWDSDYRAKLAAAGGY